MSKQFAVCSSRSMMTRPLPSNQAPFNVLTDDEEKYIRCIAYNDVNWRKASRCELMNPRPDDEDDQGGYSLFGPRHDIAYLLYNERYKRYLNRGTLLHEHPLPPNYSPFNFIVHNDYSEQVFPETSRLTAPVPTPAPSSNINPTNINPNFQSPPPSNRSPRRRRTPGSQHRRVQSFPPLNSYRSPPPDLLGSPDLRMSAAASQDDLVRLNLGMNTDHVLNKNGVIAFVVTGVATEKSDGSRSIQDMVIFLHPVSDVILASTQSGRSAFKAALLEDGSGFTLVHPGRKPFELHQGRSWRNIGHVISDLPAGCDQQQAELSLQLALQARSASGEVREIEIPQTQTFVQVPMDATTYLLPDGITCNNEFFNGTQENEFSLSVEIKVASLLYHPRLAAQLFRNKLTELRGPGATPITEDMAAQAFHNCFAQINAAKPQAHAYIRILMAIDKSSNSCIGGKKSDHTAAVADDDFYGLSEDFDRMNFSG